MITLIAGNPEVDFLYQHKKGNSRYLLDTAKIKTELEGVPINHPEVINAIRADFQTSQTCPTCLTRLTGEI